MGQAMVSVAGPPCYQATFTPQTYPLAAAAAAATISSYNTMHQLLYTGQRKLLAAVKITQNFALTVVTPNAPNIWIPFCNVALES